MEINDTSPPLYQITQTKYLCFVLAEQKPKTSVYAVQSKNSGSILGEIRWYAAWRQYTFMPTEETVFNSECLNDIIKFINNLMESRKQ